VKGDHLLDKDVEVLFNISFLKVQILIPKDVQDSLENK